MSNIKQIRLNGTTYDIKDKDATKTVTLTQAEYDALATKDSNTFYVISDATDQLGGLSLVKLTQSEYDALETKDSNTLYIITTATSS